MQVLRSKGFTRKKDNYSSAEDFANYLQQIMENPGQTWFRPRDGVQAFVGDIGEPGGAVIIINNRTHGNQPTTFVRRDFEDFLDEADFIKQ